MNDYLPQDTISALWDRIEMLHLAYLQEDQNSKKVSEKMRLEALIRRYLLIVPPQKKFIFELTRKVLQDSIHVNEDFSCYRTSAAWRGMATYAQNLLAQPWRKEFRVIKLFNGFYKHNIEGTLVGGDVMLQLMGYRKIRDNLLVFEDPIDPDRVAGVSKDSMIASIECQIMRSIYGEVFKNNKEIKWMDIFLYRETYPGTEDEAIAALSMIPNDPFDVDYGNPATYFQSMYPVSQPVPNVISPHQVIPQLESDQLYQTDGYHYRQTIPDYHHARLIARGSQYVPCPTGQLIEYESSLQATRSSVNVVPSHHAQVGQHHRRSSSDHAMSSSGAGDMNYICHGRRPSQGYRTTGNSSVWDLESEIWPTCSQEFIDREEQTNIVERNPAYFRKDINSSGNCLSRDRIQKSEINKSSVNVDELDECFKELWRQALTNVSDLKRQSMNSRKKKRFRELPKQECYEETNSPTKFIEIPTRENQRSSMLRVNLDTSAQSEEDSNKWSCQFCTFLNSPVKEVCEICGKSKITEAEVPLASGGRQCPKCTLVNKRGAMKCDVCDTSLKDSPTYI